MSCRNATRRDINTDMLWNLGTTKFKNVITHFHDHKLKFRWHRVIVNMNTKLSVVTFFNLIVFCNVH